MKISSAAASTSPIKLQKDRIEFPILCPVPKHQYQSENKMIKKQLSENRYKNLTIQEAFP